MKRFVKTIQGHKLSNQKDWRETANGRWSDDPDLKK